MRRLRCLIPVLLLLGCESELINTPKSSIDEASLSVAAGVGNQLTTPPNPCTACVLSPTTFTRSEAQTPVREFAADPLGDYVLIVQDDGHPTTGALITLNGKTIVSRTALQGLEVAELKVSTSLKSSNRLTVFPLGRVGAKVTVWILRIGGNVWTTKASMPTPHASHGVGVVNGILYAVGGVNQFVTYGRDVEAYDPVTNSWTTRGEMRTPRDGLAVGVVNGILYAVGGVDIFFNLLGVEAYDPLTNSWTTKAAMPTGRTKLAVGVVNGILYAVGGEDGSSNSLGNVEAYDPVTNSWTIKPPMPTPRIGLAVGVVNGILYAVGGHITSVGGTGAVEAYDPVTNSWTTKASMPTPRSGLAVGVVNGILYAVGGSDASATGVTEAYDPVTNSWTTKAAMPTPRFDLAAGVVNGILYAVGGSGVFFSRLETVEAYKP